MRRIAEYAYPRTRMAATWIGQRLAADGQTVTFTLELAGQLD